MKRETLLLSRADVARLLPLDECIAVVEDAFRRHALDAGVMSVEGMHAHSERSSQISKTEERAKTR